MANFQILDFISKLTKFSSRQGKNEKVATDFILSVLEEQGVSYSLQKFTTKIPVSKKAVLTADGEKILCANSSFVSGKIIGKNHLISSLTSSQSFLFSSNINFNPECSVISLSNSYFAPSVAIKAEDVSKIIKAVKVRGEVKVGSLKHQSMNILVGNKINPKFILFAHYDSIKTGATDNASGVAVMMKMILSKPETLENSLYVFSGNEELSYDKPIYWGHGFRVFEQKYPGLLKVCRKIFVIDCVGNSKTNISQDKHLLHLGFPLKNIAKISQKTYFVYGSLEKLMKVYHSDIDTIDQLEEKYLREAVKKTLAEMQA